MPAPVAGGKWRRRAGAGCRGKVVPSRRRRLPGESCTTHMFENTYRLSGGTYKMRISSTFGAGAPAPVAGEQKLHQKGLPPLAMASNLLAMASSL